MKNLQSDTTIGVKSSVNTTRPIKLRLKGDYFKRRYGFLTRTRDEFEDEPRMVCFYDSIKLIAVNDGKLIKIAAAVEEWFKGRVHNNRRYKIFS